MIDLVSLPATHKTIIDQANRYDAFPVAARNANTVVSLWRSAVEDGHVTDGTSHIKGSVSTDGGVTWSAPGIRWDNASATVGVTPVGLVWVEEAAKFYCLALLVIGITPSKSYDHELLSSPDGVTWTRVGSVPWVGPAWAFGSDLAVRTRPDGTVEMVAAAYGRRTDGLWWEPLVIVSLDFGATWSSTLYPTLGGAGALGLEVGEPQLCWDGNQWILSGRSDTDFVIRTTRTPNLFAWDGWALGLGDATGLPEIAKIAPDGTLMCWYRQRPPVGGTHGLTGWAMSSDAGRNWSTYGDPTVGIGESAGKYMMYGAIVPMPDESVLVVYAHEDDVSDLWGTSSVHSVVFKPQRITATEVLDDGAPHIRIETNVPVATLDRIGADPRTGRTIRSQVRTASEDGTVWQDFELQQGSSAYYEAAGRVTGQVTMPVLDETWLIHPYRPQSLSRAVVLGEDAERKFDLDANLVRVPGRADPVVVRLGRRSTAQGQTELVTETLEDSHRLEDLLADGGPLFVSAHPGIDLPTWIQPLGLSRAREVQWCEDQERLWELAWVQIRRPLVVALPERLRIRDMAIALEDMTRTIDAGMVRPADLY